MYTRVLIGFGLLGSLILFQNCQGAQHGSSDSSSTESKASSLAPSTVDDSEDSSDATAGEGSETRDDGSGNYVCILDGPGKSVKLAQQDGALAGQNAIPKVVCMSTHACADIVSAEFVVKGPELRGYCKTNGNPHVSHLSDAQITALVVKK